METEEFTLYMAMLAFAGSCVAMTLQFVIKSRCTRLSCCGRECIIRDVLPADQANIQIPENLVRIRQP